MTTRDRARKMPWLLGCLLIVSFSFIMFGCSSVSNNGPSAELTPCEARPEMCTMDYVPVCGELDDGTQKTYSNACNACADPRVTGYRPDPCP